MQTDIYLGNYTPQSNVIKKRSTDEKNPFINPREWKEYIRDLRQAYNKMVEEEGQMYKLIIIDDEKKILDGIAELFPWKNIGFEVVGNTRELERRLNIWKIIV